MTLEYITRYGGFDTSYDAIQDLNERKHNIDYYNFSECVRVANSYLALGKQCELQPTKDFEHYPRLCKDFYREIMTELLDYSLYPDMAQESINECIKDFDLMEEMHSW